MATSKKTNIVKTDDIETEVTKVDTNKVKDFKPEDVIECRSVTSGELIASGNKSGILYRWANYGDVQYVEYQDLLAWKSARSGYIITPYFVIEDEDLLNKWSDIKKIHDNIKECDCDQIFALSVQHFKLKITNMPESYRMVIVNMARSKIESGELDSVQKIKAIDEVYGTSLLSHLSEN